MAKQEINITTVTHPKYDPSSYWNKFRDTLNSGHDFVTNHLEKFSVRETAAEFTTRKSISYCPAHAKAALIDVKNAIYQRMVDITRADGVKSYQEAIVGDQLGVDKNGASMNSFVGRTILPELLALGKVGVFIDKQEVENPLTKAQTSGIRPYLYHYTAENIRSWKYDEHGTLVTLLLRDYVDQDYENLELPQEQVARFRLLTLTTAGVNVQFYDADGNPTDTAKIEVSRIPFVIFEITHSLLTDVSDYQIALLNLESSDMSYSLKANFPFYTEQFDPYTDMGDLRPQEQDLAEEGEATPAAIAKDNEVTVGAVKGRKYAKELNAPSFIHPSAEPLNASMQKQENLKNDIRVLMDLNIATLEPKRESAESKAADQTGLESGLSYIGLALEQGEGQISSIWNEYETSSVDSATISYPTKYSLRTDEDRRNEAKELDGLKSNVPSPTFQKKITEKIANTLLGTSVSKSTLDTIYNEIENTKVIVTDPEVIRADHEAGLVSTGLASELRGYPEGEVEQAAKDHAERAQRIALAQSKIPDLSNEPTQEAKKEKEDSQSSELNPEASKKQVRGEE